MWCWHRIKEDSESDGMGLCPACRTPYGDDPHQFSAVDMEEVVKANKEKAAAEKREKERMKQEQRELQMQQHAQTNNASGSLLGDDSSGGSGAGVDSYSSHHFDSRDYCSSVGANIQSFGGSSGTTGTSNIIISGARSNEPPRDRSQLANMRVIRRNLVYAVGLPPSVATEETLKKPEYFGQYGKIAKIVLNRNHNGNGDPRRVSASAYVTFAFKEDTLASILALDGFYLDGRNIRASYGTSKYCSAFIKNVRCNNPDCTYLHGMGESDDTFTKQEIQAGYVTSGRDDLARQQQIAAATAAAAAQNSGNGQTRRRVGGGGPSGTGKVPSNSILPAPCYEEPDRSSAKVQRAVSVGASSTTSSSAIFSSTSSDPPLSHAAAVVSGLASHKSAVSRSVTIPPSTSQAISISSSNSTTSGSGKTPAVSLSTSEKLTRQQEQLRRMHPQNQASVSGRKGSIGASVAQNVALQLSSAPSSITGTTAASVVAGTAASGPTNMPLNQSAPLTTLTPLTPLKRATSVPVSASKIVSAQSSQRAPGKVTGKRGSTTVGVGSDPYTNAAIEKNIYHDEGAKAVRHLSVGSVSNNHQPSHAGSPSHACSPSVGGPVGASSINSRPSSPIGLSRSSSSPSASTSGSLGTGFIGGPVLTTKTSPIGHNFQNNINTRAIGSGASSNNFLFPNSFGSTVGGGSSAFGSIGSGPAPSSMLGHINGHTNRSRNGQWSNQVGNVVKPRSEAHGSSEGWGTNNSIEAHKSSSFGSSGLFTGSGAFGLSGGGIWGTNEANNANSSSASSTLRGSHNGPASFSTTDGRRGDGFQGCLGINDANNANTVSQNNNGGFPCVGDSNDPNSLNRNPFSSNSSALASILGIDLPTGPASLREQSSVPNTPHQHITSQSTPAPCIPTSSYSSVGIPIAGPGVSGSNNGSLWSRTNGVSQGVGGQVTSTAQLTSNPFNQHQGGNLLRSSNLQSAVVGSVNHNKHHPNSGLINSNGVVVGAPVGGVVIGGAGVRANNVSGPTGNSDIALLQSLLPGVHITSGNAHQPASAQQTQHLQGFSSGGTGDSWGTQQNLVDISQGRNVNNNNNSTSQASSVGDTWGGNSSLYGSGASGGLPRQGMSNQSSIW